MLNESLIRTTYTVDWCVIRFIFQHGILLENESKQNRNGSFTHHSLFALKIVYSYVIEVADSESDPN